MKFVLILIRKIKDICNQPPLMIETDGLNKIRLVDGGGGGFALHLVYLAMVV